MTVSARVDAVFVVRAPRVVRLAQPHRARAKPRQQAPAPKLGLVPVGRTSTAATPTAEHVYGQGSAGRRETSSRRRRRRRSGLAGCRRSPAANRAEHPSVTLRPRSGDRLAESDQTGRETNCAIPRRDDPLRQARRQNRRPDKQTSGTRAGNLSLFGVELRHVRRRTEVDPLARPHEDDAVEEGRSLPRPAESRAPFGRAGVRAFHLRRGARPVLQLSFASCAGWSRGSGSTSVFRGGPHGTLGLRLGSRIRLRRLPCAGDGRATLYLGFAGLRAGTPQVLVHRGRRLLGGRRRRG